MNTSNGDQEGWKERNQGPAGPSGPPPSDTPRTGEPKEHLDPEECFRKYPELSAELKKLFKGLSRLSGLDREARGESLESRGKSYQVIGDFRILREIGSGGMARVFEAEQLSLKRRVALKVLPPHLSLSETSVQKFLREAEAAGRQQHPGIVTIYAVGEHDGIHYIAQELVEGGISLADRLVDHRKGANLPRGYFREAAKTISDVADALQHAHASGVIHRDIKPSNILLTREGRPLITDFGLARVEDALTLSRSGEFAGTPYYMSPEQAAGLHDEIDHRTDVYSLGVTLYESITLERPFDGDKSQEVLKQVLYHEPGDPRKKNPRIPRDLAVICLKAMDKDAKLRYQTMAKFGKDLRRFLLGEPISARPAGPLRKTARWIRGHKIASLAAAAVLMAIMAVTVLAYVMSHQRRQDRMILAERYKPINEALQWATDVKYGYPWSWCNQCDPSDPGGYLLKALLEMKGSQYIEAEESLEQCIEKCRLLDERDIEKDAVYLLRVVKARLLALADSRNARSHEITETSELVALRASEFDPFHPEAFVWHYPEGPAGAGEDSSWYQRPLLLNRTHFLAQLFQGVYYFQFLFRGGEVRDFEMAMNHLEYVLKVRDGHIAAHIALSRLQFFFARCFNAFDILEAAGWHLDRALQTAGEKPYFMARTTYGQIRLLRGEIDQALEDFETAEGQYDEMLKTLGPGKSKLEHAHNIFRGLGDVLARKGRYDDAMDHFKKAEELVKTDTHLQVSVAEFYLHRKQWNEAMKYAEKSMRTGSMELSTDIASPYLICGRLRLIEEQYDEAAALLLKIYSSARNSPREKSLACLLAATFPEEKRDDKLGVMANTIASEFRRYPDEYPLCISALGAAAYMHGKFEEAVEFFMQAIKKREGWPEATRDYYWADTARDQYFLASAHRRIGDGSEDGKAHVQEAGTFFDQAENELELRGLPYEYPDILERVREMAKETLGR